MNDNSNKQSLKYGFTTGSCAAAAAKAATYMLLSGKPKYTIKIDTPKGIAFNAEILDILIEESRAKCAVIKDGGDDPDVTTGLKIYAEVSLIDTDRPRVVIEGGDGIGLVTRPGLNQPVGNHAINSVPREMIIKEVEEVLDLWDPDVKIRVVVSAPGGDKVAEKTFNPRLGIKGGISIIGTTGIVEPMSVDALIDTIKVELNQKKAMGYEIVSVTPGNYGLDFMKAEYGFDLNQSVRCSNYIGVTCDEIQMLGFRKMLLTGHAGKLVKIAGGIMNTHSREADSRLEIIAAAAIKSGVEGSVPIKLLESNTTEEAFEILKDIGFAEKVAGILIDGILHYLDRRLGGDIEIECVMFTNKMGLLGESSGARTLIEEIKKNAVS